MEPGANSQYDVFFEPEADEGPHNSAASSSERRHSLEGSFHDPDDVDSAQNFDARHNFEAHEEGNGATGNEQSDGPISTESPRSITDGDNVSLEAKKTEASPNSALPNQSNETTLPEPSVENTTASSAEKDQPNIPLPPAKSQQRHGVIDLVESDSESGEADTSLNSSNKNAAHVAKKQRTDGTTSVTPRPTIQPGMTLPVFSAAERPQYLTLPGGFIPTWRQLHPSVTTNRNAPTAGEANEYSGLSLPRRFRLSLLNVNEFTITGLPLQFGGAPTPVTNLRTAIRQISRDHGKPVFERDKEGLGGKWRIPLGAYHAFVAYLTNSQNTEVEGIPQHQLQIASLERARQEKGYPTYEQVLEMGVPAQVARSLAPFQMGGVGFVREKQGRALIADDMGLGKSIQGVASMTMYSDEWPLLVLCPSSARYHWASEFMRWLGRDDNNLSASLPNDGFSHGQGEQQQQNSAANEKKHDWKLLDEEQINVLASSRDPIFPLTNTRVVICSYGLAPALIASGKIFSGLFKCAIVDESHMLKNKNTKRTQALVPILQNTTRCLLLSGTPAFARPSELWPQLEIIGTSRYGWWEDEREFLSRYGKNASAQRRAELHTLLTGTVMIRRLKPDMLQNLPRKLREKASVRLLDQEKSMEFKDLLMHLKQSKGALGKIARKEGTFSDGENEPNPHVGMAVARPKQTAALPSTQLSFAEEECRIHGEIRREMEDKRRQILVYLQARSNEMSPPEFHAMRVQLEGQMRVEMEIKYREKIDKVVHQRNQTPEPEDCRKNLLTRLYALTGEVKIPLVVDMLNRWIKDPTKGKVCIFAHHLSVLDGIASGCELSNYPSSHRKYIRIDGSTSPKSRQEQIDIFQKDPTVRVALLGITAAGVAVTLTASSTVWFAELFWTPALMVQAEDRAHRIGQASRVRCLYLVAKGTLDDVLWKLIEKKFQDLGEFVEGKERMKMVVHNEYKSANELLSMFETEIKKDEEEDEDIVDDFMADDLFADEGIEHDIMSLGEMERRMIKEDADEDDTPDSEEDLDQKPSAMELAPLKKSDGLGSTEEAAITLSSGEESDGEEEVPSTTKPVASAASSEPTRESSTGQTPNATATHPPPDPLWWDTPLPDCRLYRMTFYGASIGVDLAVFQGRIVISKIIQHRLDRLGPDSKPAVGDVFVTINTTTLPLNLACETFRTCTRGAFERGPVHAVFAESPKIRDAYLSSSGPAVAPPPKMPTGSSDDVIEIEDSDDD